MSQFFDSAPGWAPQLLSNQYGGLFYFLEIPKTYTIRVSHLKSKMELPPLNTDTIWAILLEKIDDNTVNQLVWHYLGYRYDESAGKWDASNVSEDWRCEYPEPPDFIANRPPTVKLTRSIPKENKQIVKEELGFKGYKIGEFGPRQTRRATAANWLLSYIKINS